MGIEIHVPETTELAPPQPETFRDPYRGAVLAMLAAALLGLIATAAGGVMFESRELLAAAITLALASGVLTGVVAAQLARIRPHTRPAAEPPREETPHVASLEEVSLENSLLEGPAIHVESEGVSTDETAKPQSLFHRLGRTARNVIGASKTSTLSDLAALTADKIRVATAALGALAIWLVITADFVAVPLAPSPTAIAAALCLIGAALSAMTTRYLAAIEPNQLPEAPGLCRGARVTAWMLALTAVSIGFVWMGQRTVAGIILFVVLAINAGLCYGLIVAKKSPGDRRETFPLDLGVLSIFGSRTNILASALDAAERQLGIDLRSTWALTVIRSALEPLVISLCLLGWLSTSFTVVGVEQDGLVERFGVPLGGQPLQPGLHLHWPWPVDQVFRIPTKHVQAITVGHEGEEEGGPENVLWAVEHAPNEYTLLLGNGRDLITIDAAVQFRIMYPAAWRYHCQNPEDALRAMAYRAVMRNTVNRTLSDALSENVASLTATMRDTLQKDADALGLGVEITGFTVGGMHPPVPVAEAYQAVVSAEIRRATVIANAQAYRNRTLPDAEGIAIDATMSAQSDGAQARGRAAGEAWSFRTLESQYRASPQEFTFRQRLETLEKGLGSRNFTVVDSRIQRDGGELWVIP